MAGSRAVRVERAVIAASDGETEVERVPPRTSPAHAPSIKTFAGARSPASSEEDPGDISSFVRLEYPVPLRDYCSQCCSRSLSVRSGARI